MVGAALHRHPVSLSLPLLAGPWPGKTEPSAGHPAIFNCYAEAYVFSNHTISLVLQHMFSHVFQGQSSLELLFQFSCNGHVQLETKLYRSSIKMSLLCNYTM